MAVIEIARCAGACYGVERALKIVEGCIGTDSSVYTFGPLIHNPTVVREFEERNVRVASSISEIPPSSTVVIRSHGVVPQVIEEAVQSGLDIVDATCPHVKKAHDAASLLAQDGYQVLVIGEPGHPEVEGILARAGLNATVVSSVSDATNMRLSRKVGVVVQTTQTTELLDQICSELLPKVGELRVFNTICQATAHRQQAASDLAQKCDVMVVVGGKNSGNTRRLAEVCATSCSNTYHIESPEEIQPAWFEGAETIGVTAGASTPAIQIEKVVSRIGELS